MKKTLKYAMCSVLFLHIILLLIFGGQLSYASEDSSSTTSSSSANPGQSLYDALRTIYGGSSTSNSSSTTSSKSVPTQDEIMRMRESAIKGPTVQEVSLSELYHENYRVYEESLSPDVSIYTNVSNGKMINRPVVLDIPDGVAAVMKKNGSVVPIESRKAISDEGSYVVTFYVQGEDEDSKPFSEQKVSKAKFRFRIQYGTGVAGVDAINGEPEFPLETVSGDNERLFGTEDDSESAESMPSDLKPDEFDYSELAVSDNALLPAKPEETQKPEDKAAETAPAGGSFMAVNGMSGTYDAASGFYKNTLMTGEEFFTNVPNGMLTNDPVMIQAADNLSYTVYKDGEILPDYEPGQYIGDAGSYAVEVSGTEADFASAYGGKLPVFHFRIFKGPVSDAGILNAPENMNFRSVRYEGEIVSDAVRLSDKSLRLLRDGTYEITLESPEGSMEVIVALDTLQPIVGVSAEPNHASISYLTDDTARVELYRGEELISDGEPVSSIEGPGNYLLIVHDSAGNTNSVEFNVRYRINVAAVIAIIIALGLVAALVFYILKIRKGVSIR